MYNFIIGIPVDFTAALGIAAISIGLVAIVTIFARCKVDDAIATGGPGAIPVAVLSIATIRIMLRLFH